MKNTTAEKATDFDWAFDPLDPSGDVMIRCNGISFALTKTVSNADRMCKMLNEHDLLNAVAEAAEKTLTNGESYMDMRRLQVAFTALKSFREGGK